MIDALARAISLEQFQPGNPRDFVNRLWPHAAEASRTTGIPAHFIIGQAALESGICWSLKSKDEEAAIRRIAELEAELLRLKNPGAA